MYLVSISKRISRSVPHINHIIREFHNIPRKTRSSHHILICKHCSYFCMMFRHIKTQLPASGVYSNPEVIILIPSRLYKVVSTSQSTYRTESTITVYKIRYVSTVIGYRSIVYLKSHRDYIANVLIKLYEINIYVSIVTSLNATSDIYSNYLRKYAFTYRHGKSYTTTHALMSIRHNCNGITCETLII